MQRRKRQLTQPQREISLVLYIYMFVGIAFSAATYAYLHAISTDLEEMRSQLSLPLSATAGMNSIVIQAMIVAACAGVALFLMTVLVSAALQSRVFGPEVPIRRLIGKLRAGEYGAKGGLRKFDEFKDVMEDLNALSTELAEKHGVKAGVPS